MPTNDKRDHDIDDIEAPYISPSHSNYTRETTTGWFVGIIVALALLSIGYLVFSANQPTPSVTAPPAASSDSAVGVKQ